MLLLNNSAVTDLFELGCHKKNEKCGKGPYIYDVHKEWRWEVLKVVMCSWILLLIFADGWGGRVIKLMSFCGYHTHGLCLSDWNGKCFLTSVRNTFHSTF